MRLGPEQASSRLVLLHGWGADADDLLDLGELLVGPEVSVVALRARLEDLAASVALERTVLLGFSQGAAMALDVGCGLPLAGIVGCSGYPHEGWQPGGTLPPVLLSHGREDAVVPYAASEELQRQLVRAGARVELLPFSGGHGIDPELLPAVAAFVQRCLGAAG